MTSKVTYCRTCECFCGLIAEIDGDRVVDLRGDPDQPMSRGNICIKGRALRELHHDPDRLRHPVRRAATGDLETISWDAAIDGVAAGLRSVRDRHGADAIAIYIGMGAFYGTLSIPSATAFIRGLEIGKVYSSMTIDCAALNRVALSMFGEPSNRAFPDWQNARYMLVLGHNPVVSKFGQSQNQPRGLDAIRQARAAGGRLVIIDPRRTETCRFADEHHFIRPGTDLFLVLALLHTIISEKLFDADFVARYCDGFEQLCRAVETWTPESASVETGIPADTIRGIARDFASTTPAFCIGRAGITMGPNSTLTEWAIFALNAIAGNFDRPGGLRWNPVPKHGLSIGRVSRSRPAPQHTRPAGIPRFLGEFPSATMADEILTHGEGQVRALLVLGGNPILSFPNGRKLEQALRSLDLLVSIDLYVNQTGAFAHYVLPAADPLERSEVHSPLATRNFPRQFIQSTPRVVEPKGEVWEDWRILRQLARRLGLPAFQNTSIENDLDSLEQSGASPDALTNALLDHLLEHSGWTTETLSHNPHGVILAEPAYGLMRRDGWATATGRVQLAPPELIDGLAKLDLSRPDSQSGARRFTLIGQRVPSNHNSGLRNLPSLVRAKRENTALINDQDAAEMGITAGQRITVTSLVGQISIPAQPTPEVAPGVVAIAHGWGHHHRSGQQLARRYPGQNPNVLIDDQDLDPFTGSPLQNGTTVWIS